MSDETKDERRARLEALLEEIRDTVPPPSAPASAFALEPPDHISTLPPEPSGLAPPPPVVSDPADLGGLDALAASGATPDVDERDSFGDLFSEPPRAMPDEGRAPETSVPDLGMLDGDWDPDSTVVAANPLSFDLPEKRAEAKREATPPPAVVAPVAVVAAVAQPEAPKPVVPAFVAPVAKPVVAVEAPARAVTPPPVAPVAPVVAKPVETKPVETKPVVTKPVVTKPVVTKPVVTAPVAAKPVETNPVVPAPVVAKPVESKPAEPKAVVTAPVAAKPVETKPVVSAPVAATSVETKPIVTAPVAAKAVETKALEATPSQPKPAPTPKPVVRVSEPKIAPSAQLGAASGASGASATASVAASRPAATPASHQATHRAVAAIAKPSAPQSQGPARLTKRQRREVERKAALAARVAGAETADAKVETRKQKMRAREAERKERAKAKDAARRAKAKTPLHEQGDDAPKSEAAPKPVRAKARRLAEALESKPSSQPPSSRRSGASKASKPTLAQRLFGTERDRAQWKILALVAAIVATVAIFGMLLLKR